MSLSKSIRATHDSLASLFDQMVDSLDADDQTRLQNQFVWELARHLVAEELVLYPAMAKYVDRGVLDLDRDRREHESIKYYLRLFQGIPPQDPRFTSTITRLMGELRAHLRREQDTELVLLENAITSEENLRLAKSLSRTKLFVPTRAHPQAPDQPPFETAASLLLAPMDMLNDLLRRWP
ncbi:hypothetical protein ASPZODRAFT_151818 [Penicilliopsis zonata CBS 506.65]|uniref:Hemerythrin-like domain-containing protein n=1 Tax=Penicilliopsis zonata CBS 506.65 TaxID=1073090 RepID=A0A1L9SJP1_9EURO|nr:hypothetical protein ASPZODRAFT_151818 [Penicilliopsis zonata CBS 506.65]OJJ47313.1 hypothetical protein ASPZODRAFT_151818 [Penicilliopsis zonata CBS 506.65]